MAEIDEVVTDRPGEPASPLEDISGAFARYGESDEKPKEPKDEAPKEPSPAPVVETPTTPPQDWEKIARETQGRLEKLERDLASRSAPSPVVAEPPKEQPKEDPRWTEVRDNQFSDPEKALAIQRAILADEARAIAGEEFDRREQAAERQRHARASIEASGAAVSKIATAYGVTPKIAEAMVLGSLRHISAAVETMKNDGLWLMPENYEIAVRAEYGEPAPAVATADVPPPPAVIPDPPGSKSSAPPAQRRIAAVPPLSPEANRSLSSLASSVGLSAEGAERLKQRVAGKV